MNTNTNPLFHQLLTRFKEKTGCPVLVNTSFNVREPEEAFRCFMGNELDLLVGGNCIFAEGRTKPQARLQFGNSKPD